MNAIVVVAALAAAADRPVPPKQRDAYAEMGREWAEVLRVDKNARTMTARREKDDKVVTVPVPEIVGFRFRDSWGQLDDYTPGMRVFLFMFVDEDLTWTYPEGILDEFWFYARHNRYAKITSLDPSKRTATGVYPVKPTRTAPPETVTFALAPDAKVWHGGAVGGFDTLRVGDEVVAQRFYRGKELVTAEVADRAGVDVIRKDQDGKHAKLLERIGLPAEVGDREPVTGAVVLNVYPAGTARVNDLKPGQAITITPADGANPFALVVSEVEGRGDRGVRLHGVARSYAAARLRVGQAVRAWLPGTGPKLPEGKSGVLVP